MAGKKNTVFDDEEELDVEEEEEQGDAVDSDEEDEEDDGPDDYEKDDFLVDEVEEEEDAEEQERQRKKKKKKNPEKNFELDQDDYDLLEDNNITGFRRPKESQKLKRLRKKGQTSAGNDGPGYYDDEFDGGGKRARTTEEQLKRTLFGDDEGPPLEDAEEEEQSIEDEDGDGLGDFIVEGDEYNEHMRQGKVKKKPRQAHGVSSDKIQEALEIFGDVDEFLMLRKQGLAKMGKYGESSERRLEDEFEPLILSEKYMTEKDDEIRQIDIPERMQISEETTGPPPTDETSIEEESSWIYNHLVSSETNQGDHNVSVNKDDVTRFLELTHIQKLDVPFIAMYRKEECPSLFRVPGEAEGDEHNQKKRTITWHKVLWAIQDLNRKWLLLQKRKVALQSYYSKRFDDESSRIYDENRLALNKQLFKSIMESLKTADSEREVDDVDSKFNLHFPPGETGVDEGHYKRPKRKSLYSVCSSSGLWEVASKFGYSSEQFGLQISLEKMRMDELEDARETPDEMASNFTCTMFDTPQAVLKGARHMAAVEISCEPCVRKHVRCIFMDNAVVSTTPTPDGNTAIDSFHQFAGVKWLKDKPLARFEDAQWLLIQKAEEEKLLRVTIKLPDNVLNKLIADSNEYYLSDGVSKSAQLWNEQRKMILKDAFSGFLLPSMEKEARSLLSSRAKSWLRMEYGKLLWDKVSVAPYQRKENDLSSDDEAAPKVMACCWGAGKPSTTFVMLDSSGEVVDTLDAGFLSARSQNINDQQRKRNDQQRVLKFMMDHQPHVVVLGAVNLSCTRLKDDIYEVIFKIVEDNPRDVGQELDGLSIVYGDERLSRLYESSRISSDQLPGHSGIIKRAVALGRYLQNPLAMVAALCGPGREILSWNLSPLDSFLTPDEKYLMIEQVMVDATNQVGLDVNLAIAHEWLFSPLQFISGLGPSKAAFLQRSLVRNGSIYSRKDLLTAHGIGKKVFVNAAGFLRVRRTGLAASSSQYIDLLDDTRIHPESYALAQELAKFVYLLDQGSTADDEDDDVLEMAIEHVREKPDSLKYFEVAKYAESKGLENKNVTLDIVRLELIQGFQDWRRQYEEPNPDEEFFMISGETEDTLCQGRVVQVTVRRVQSQKAFCGFESGLTGILTSQDYSDDRTNEIDLTEKLHEGDVITCKVKSIVKNRYQVYLTCKENEMRNSRRQDHQNLDPYYHEDKSSLPGEQERTRKEKELAKKHFKPRMIVHPRFQNITADEAIEFLSDKDPGESVVRPSSRGPSYLTLTLKVYDGVYAHKDIVEGGKEHKDITSLLRIGKTLKIGDDTFEDLDEVMDRYVDPLVTHLKAMLSYRKFRKGTKSEVDELLKSEKSEYPMRIVYSFGISIEHPGTFILTYIRSTNPHHEYISLYPKGFKFRKKMFEDIDRLVAYFQRHIDDPQHESGPSIPSVAAKVPMRSPAIGGSGNNDGGRGRGDDYRNSGGNRDGHPSGIPRPYGGGGRGDGRGRGRGRYNGGRGNNDSNSDGQDTEFGAQKWGGAKDDDSSPGWSNFPGAKVQNSPGREAFPGGWGTGSSDGGSGWGKSGGDSGGNNGNSGWGSTGGGSAGGWGSSGGGAGAGGGGWGNSGSGGGIGGDRGGNNGGSGWGSSGGGGSGGGSGGWGSSGGGDGGGSGGWGNSGSAGGGNSGGWGSNVAASNGGGWGQGSEGGFSGGGGRGGNRDGGGWGQGSGGGRGGNRDDGGSRGRGRGRGGNRDGGGWSDGGRGGNRDGGGWSEGGRGGNRDGGGWSGGRGGNRDGGGWSGGRGGNRDGGGWSDGGRGGRGFGGGRRGGRGGNRDGGSSGGGWSQGGGGGSWGSNGSGNNDGGGSNWGSNGGGNSGGAAASNWGSWGQGSGGGSGGGGGGGSGWGQASGSSAGGGSGWGDGKSSAGAEQGGSGWGASKTPAPQGGSGGGSGWGATKSPAQQDVSGGGGSSWGAAAKQDGNSGGGSGWGAMKSPAPQDAASTGGGGSGWGSATKSTALQDGSSGGGSGWGAAKSPAQQGAGGGGGSGWGAPPKNAAPHDGGNSGGSGGWGAPPQGGSSGGGSGGWGAPPKSAAPEDGGNSGGGSGGWGAPQKSAAAPQDGNSGGGGSAGWGAPPKSPAQQGGSGGGWGSGGGGW